MILWPILFTFLIIPTATISMYRFIIKQVNQKSFKHPFSSSLSRQFTFRRFCKSAVDSINNNSKDMEVQLTQQQRDAILQTIYESSSPRHVFSLCITGGGAEIVPWLLTVPGSSNSVMDCIVPYSRHASAQFMKPSTSASSSSSIASSSSSSSTTKGGISSSSNMGCNDETAIKLAKQSYQNAMNSLLAEKDQLHHLHNTNIFGIACTAALISKQPKKGLHRCHVACYDSKGIITSYSYILTRGSRSRIEEDRLCASILLQAIINQCHQHTMTMTTTTGSSTSINLFPSMKIIDNNSNHHHHNSSSFKSNSDINNQTILLPSKQSQIQQDIQKKEQGEGQEEEEEEVLYRKRLEPTMDMLDTLYQNQTQQILYIPRTTTTSSSSSSRNSHNPSHEKNSDNSSNRDVIISGNSDMSENDEFLTYADLSLPTDTLVYPGSFNPLHEGHVALVAAALRLMATNTNTSSSTGVNTSCDHEGIDMMTNQLSKEPSSSSSSTNHNGTASHNNTTTTTTHHHHPLYFTHTHPIVIFEIAAVNADKPPLSREIVLERIRQFHPRHPLGQQLHAAGITNYGVCVTSKPLFIQKSECFNHCIFVIGADTFSRLIDSKYYYTPPTPANLSSTATTSSTTVSMTPAVGTTQSTTQDLSLSTDSSVQQQQTQQQEMKMMMISQLNMASALTTIVNNGCRFIVGGRKKSTISHSISNNNGSNNSNNNGSSNSNSSCNNSSSSNNNNSSRNSSNSSAVPLTQPQQHQHDDNFQTLTDLSVSLESLPAAISSMFIGLSEEQFRVDVSSTEIRQRRKSLEKQ